VCAVCLFIHKKSASYVYVSFVNFMHIAHELDIDITSTFIHDECQYSVIMYACAYVSSNIYTCIYTCVCVSMWVLDSSLGAG